MTRWLVVGVLVVLPILANAECGWLLMMPTSLSREVRSNRAFIVAPPLNEWRQISAFDSAARCEDRLRGVIQGLEKSLPDSSGVANQVMMGKYWDLTEDQQAYIRWAFSRCLPASQVTVR